jgi:alpha-amylase/alpha-mannosidase (GH57 family)
MPIHLVIHGHFYQPPRENPWTGTIERQESAAPFHDWNARIAEECYLPNARSRVLDERGRIQDIVNNYERISFNFGPTLLSWLAAEAPELLGALRAADQASIARLGYGNAIAQTYNHLIMPLASPRDRQTQIRWAVREFRHRFHRVPDALWLAETAVDEATLRLLVDAGMQFLILSPAQAARWRPLEDAAWRTPAETEIDPRRPYRWIYRDSRGQAHGDRGIDICFYHASLSRGISFQHYLRDAGLLAARIVEAAGETPDPLILIATDGESFGHHEKFGEMCLATLFSREAPRHGFEVTNLAAYLATHRPTWEVELLPESAWSCSHGVGRWCEDCGCSAGGGSGWTQAWRRPLRQGLDRVRDALASIFQEEGSTLFRDPWAARDEYIELLLDGHPAARDAFFDRHQAGPLDSVRRGRALRLLEMQHHAMLMYTSCAWFFSDISGIETVQNLRYAARAIELAAPFAPLDLEAVLLEELGRARSNLEIHRDGRKLWERQVRPSRVTAEHAVARLLADGLLGHAVRARVLFRWSLVPDPVVQEGGFVLAAVGATSEVTGETLQFGGACRRDGAFGFLAGIASLPSPEAWTAFAADARTALAPDGRQLVAWSGRHAARLLRLHDLLPDERHALLRQFLAEADAALVKDSVRLCDEALPVAEAMAAAGMPLPGWLKTLLEAHWSARFADALAGLGGVADPAAYAGLLDLSVRARLLGIGLDFSSASLAFGRTLLARLEAIADVPEAGRWHEFLDLLQLASRLGLGVPERALQDRMFALLRTRLPGWVGELRDIHDARYGAVAAMLAVATRLNLRTEELRERLAPLEAPVAADPTYWP